MFQNLAKLNTSIIHNLEISLPDPRENPTESKRGVQKLGALVRSKKQPGWSSLGHYLGKCGHCTWQVVSSSWRPRLRRMRGTTWHPMKFFQV